MATFLSYASCYGNKPAHQLMDRRNYLSLLGIPPCLRHRRRKRPAPELTVMQLSRMIRVLRELRCQSPRDHQPAGLRSPAARGASKSCRPKSLGKACVACLQYRHKQAG